jgi:hypothetical protein
MGKFVFGVVVGYFLCQWQVLPEMVKFYGESGLNEFLIQSLQGLK